MPSNDMLRERERVRELTKIAQLLSNILQDIEKSDLINLPEDEELFNFLVTGTETGSIVLAHNQSEAKRIFLSVYPSEKVLNIKVSTVLP